MKLVIACFLFFFSLSVNLFAESIKIPVIIGQTGASAAFGQEELLAYQMAAEEWNQRGGILGRQIELLVEDSQTSNVKILAAFQRLKGLANVSVVLGPTWLDGFPAIIPLAQKDDFALVTPSAASEAFGSNQDWPLSFYYNTTIEVSSLLNRLNKDGYKKIALVYEAEPYAELVRKIIQEKNPQLLFDQGVQGGETDFRSILAKLKQSDAQVVLLLLWQESSLLSFLQQKRTSHPQLPIATVHDGASWLMRKDFQLQLEELYYTEFQLSNMMFKERFKDRYGTAPLQTAANAYDAANAVFQALSSGAKSGAMIRKFLLDTLHQTVTFGDVKLSTKGISSTSVKVKHFLAQD